MATDRLPPLTVQIPIFSVRHGTAAGLESSVSNLVAGMSQAGVSVNLPFSDYGRLNPEFTSWAHAQQNVKFEKYTAVNGGTWTRFVEETLFYNAQRSRDAVIFPNYFLPPLMRGNSPPTYCYIHDCQHRVFPQYFSAKKRRWLDFNFARTLDRADEVFLISEFEQGQIGRFYGTARAQRCSVVYNPVDWERYTRGEPGEEAASLATTQFILSVSHQYVHKNSAKIVDAFARLAGQFPELRLVLVGRESTSVSQRIAAIGEAQIRARIVSLGFVSDADLGLLYGKCQVFVLASEYEGFGMPAVEAMGFGVPVVITNGSSLPEVTLHHATYVDSDSSADSWADTLKMVLRASRDELHLARAAAAVRARYKPLTVAQSVLSRVAARI